MAAYGTTHLVMLAVFVVGIAPVVWLGRARRGTGRTDRVTRGYAVLMPIAPVALLVSEVVGDFELGVTLPLHLSDLSWMVATVALWTQRPAWVALTYFWGLVLASQAIVTPSLAEDFPDPRFVAFWVLHLLVVWAAIYLVWGLGLRPRWREYRLAIVVTLLWAVLTLAFNAVADTNYGYLQRKPSGGSVLDLLGPWPVYVLAEIAIVAVVWALMTWPWEARRSRSARATGVRDGVIAGRRHR